MKSFKRILSLILLTAIFSLSLGSMVFADDVSTVIWKETASSVDQIPEGVGYNSANGTFGATGRSIANKGNGNAGYYYYFGVELPTAVKSGTVVVNASFSGITSSNTNMIDIFGLSGESDGWKNKVSSKLALKATGALLSSDEARWTSEHSSLGTTSGGAYKLAKTAYNLKLVATAANDTADWNVSIYDADSSTDIRPFYTYTIARSDLNDIKYIVNSTYCGKADTNEVKITIDKFLAETSITPEWKETQSSVDQIPEGVGYNSANGTFGATGRSIANKGNGNAGYYYYFGVELPTAVKSGTVVVNASFSGITSSNTNMIDIFGLSGESDSWQNKASSKLALKATGALLSSDNTRWTSEHSSLGTTSGGAYKLAKTVYNLKLVATAANDTAAWNVSIYDADSSTDIRPFYTYTIARSDLNDIKYIVNSTYCGKADTNEVKITIDKFQVVNSMDVVTVHDVIDETSDNKKLTAQIIATSAGKAIAAAYGTNGRFLEAVLGDVTPGDKDNNEFQFTTTEDIAEWKIMVWDGFADCTPLLKTPYLSE